MYSVLVRSVLVHSASFGTQPQSFASYLFSPPGGNFVTDKHVTGLLIGILFDYLLYVQDH